MKMSLFEKFSQSTIFFIFLKIFDNFFGLISSKTLVFPDLEISDLNGTRSFILFSPVIFFVLAKNKLQIEFEDLKER